ncbi:MAG: cupin domain-containing protein [Pseudomonadota bacterium]
MPPGTREAWHHHAQARQVFFVLSGELTMESDGSVVCLHAHEAIAVDPGKTHQARNDSSEPVQFLVISAPSTSGDRIEGG